MKTPIAAWMQNDWRAGILVKAPTRNAEVSQIAAIVMLGPTVLSAWPIRSGTLIAFCFLKLCVIMNILSTPIARMRKGMT